MRGAPCRPSDEDNLHYVEMGIGASFDRSVNPAKLGWNPDGHSRRIGAGRVLFALDASTGFDIGVGSKRSDGCRSTSHSPGSFRPVLSTGDPMTAAKFLDPGTFAMTGFGGGS